MERVDPEEEVTKGAWEGIKGKVKEAVGSAIGSERLIAAGELQQAQAEAHKEASTRQEDADRLRDQAAERFAAQEQALNDERARASEEEARRLAEVARERQLQDRTVDEDAQARVGAAHRRAEDNRRQIELHEQRAAQEREDAGREAAEQRSAAVEARAAAGDLDAIVEESDDRSSKEEL
jgi:uncharacterized protein YjbJ (UPF0337 family)